MSRIQTTHVGSLPRSQEVTDLLFAKEQGKPFEQNLFEETMRSVISCNCCFYTYFLLNFNFFETNNPDFFAMWVLLI